MAALGRGDERLDPSTRVLTVLARISEHGFQTEMTWKAEQSVRTRLLFFPTSICNPFFDEDFILINLVTVFHAILTSIGKRVRNYSDCLRIQSGCSMFWKKYDLYTKASLPRILLKKIEGVTCTRRPSTAF